MLQPWSYAGSNRGPSAHKTDALPTKLDDLDTILESIHASIIL